MTRYLRFAAIGDSFTEGLDDPAPDGGFRGWADRVAGQLAADTPDFGYANLAIRGRLLRRIVEEQLPAAIALRPDLVTIAGGTNDILRRTCDLPALMRLFSEAVRRLAATGATVVVFGGVDPTRILPWGTRLAPRVRALNDAVRSAARTHDAVLVDLWEERLFDDRRLWSLDRLHLSAEGHARVAGAVLEALGARASSTSSSSRESWREPLPPYAAPPWLAARRADVRWTREYLAPWVHRRLTGRSSGDAVLPKRPRLEPVRLDLALVSEESRPIRPDSSDTTEGTR